MVRTTAPQPDFADRQSPWTRPGFIAAAALIGLILLGGLIVIVVRDPAPAPPAPAPTGPGPAPTGATTPADALPTAIPTAGPAVRWEVVGGQTVPVSDAEGPRKVTDGVASGYARTPSGALIAAVQIASRGSVAAGRSSWEPTITEQFLPGPDRDRLLEALRAQPDTTGAIGEQAQVAGYRYITYTPDTAVLDMALRLPGREAYVLVTLTMQWRDGDWRMTPPPGGRWTSLTQQASDLAGVVRWGAS